MRQVVVVGAVLGALAAAALSGAETELPPKNALLGGGAIGTTWVSNPRAGHPDVKYTTIRVNKQNGRSVHVYAEWPVRCQGRSPVTAIFDTVAPLKPDGTFARTGSLPKTAVIPDGLRFQLTGAFDGATAARVTGSASFAFTEDGKTSACSGSDIRTQVRLPGPAGGAPAPKRGAVYYGSTSDTGSVILRVAAGGRQVAQIGEEGWLDCKTAELKRNGGPFVQNTSPPATIRANGTFGGSEHFDSLQPLLPGTVAHMTSRVTGRFGATTASGTWELQAVVVDEKTKKVEDTCQRKVTWRVSL